MNTTPTIALTWLAALLAGCGSTRLRLETNVGNVPPGSHQLGQVMGVEPLAATQSLASGEAPSDGALSILGSLHGAGIPDDELEGGSLAMLRIYCCGGPLEDEMPIVYVPRGVTVDPGDVLEFRSADPAKSGTRAVLNVAVRVRHKAVELGGPCWWDPPNENLWMRVLYAEWMPAEGWLHQGGLYPAWYKPQS